MKTMKRKSMSKKSKTKKQFLYNPNNPKKSFDVYIDKNPKDTIHIKYTTTDDVKNTILHPWRFKMAPLCQNPKGLSISGICKFWLWNFF